MKKILLICLLCFLFIGGVYAKDYSNSNLIIDEKVISDEDINNSAIIFGNSVDLASKLDGVGLIFGNDISLNLTSDYIATFGNNITFNGKTRDAIIFGNKVTLNEGATIGRDIYIFASSVSISGSINRNITIYASDVSIKDAQISGNVKIRANDIDIERNAAIIGELSYNDDANVNISDVASIGSKQTYKVEKEEKNEFLEKLKSSFISFINVLLVFAILLFLVPTIFKKLDNNKTDIIKSLGIGFAFLISALIAVIILIFTVFGLSLALLLIVAYIVLIYLSTIATGYMLGNFVWEKITKVDKKPYLIGIIGILIIYILKLIPYVSILITILSVVIGIGSILSLYKRKKETRTK